MTTVMIPGTTTVMMTTIKTPTAAIAPSRFTAHGRKKPRPRPGLFHVRGLVRNGPDEPEPFAVRVRFAGPDGHATLVFDREALGLLKFPDGNHETKIVGAKQL